MKLLLKTGSNSLTNDFQRLSTFLNALFKNINALLKTARMLGNPLKQSWRLVAACAA
jgi:hypothetical protein